MEFLQNLLFWFGLSRFDLNSTGGRLLAAALKRNGIPAAELWSSGASQLAAIAVRPQA